MKNDTEQKAFLEPGKMPADDTLRAALGTAYPYFASIDRATHDFSKRWGFTKSGGWMLRVFRRQKALFYAIPLKRALVVTLALREDEKVAFRKDVDLWEIHGELDAARKLAEGYALRFRIAGQVEYEAFERLLGKLIVARTR